MADYYEVEKAIPTLFGTDCLLRAFLAFSALDLPHFLERPLNYTASRQRIA